MARSNVLRNQSIVSTGIFGKTNVFSINSLEDSRVRTNIQSEKKTQLYFEVGGGVSAGAIFLNIPISWKIQP